MMLVWLYVSPTECVLFACYSEQKSCHFPIQQEVTGVYKQSDVLSEIYEMGR